MESVNKVRINQGRIVPWQFRLVGTGLILMGMSVSLANLSQMWAIVICIAISMLIPPLWSSYYLLEIDLKNKWISEVSWVIGLRSEDKTYFDRLEKIFINLVDESQRGTSWGGQVNTFRHKVFKSFLKLDNGNKFLLHEDKNLPRLKKKLEPIAKKLQLEIQYPN